MKKVTIFGVGNIGARVAYFLARSRDISRIRLVDIDPGRTKATVLDFLESNVALKSKIMYVSYDEPKEMDLSEVVIVASGVENKTDASVPEPSTNDIKKMEEIAAQIGHFAPTAIVAVLSQPAEIFCSVLAKSGYLEPKRVFGFPLLAYRELFRDQIARRVGISNEDIRISTVRTLDGEELVPAQTSVGGVRLSRLAPDLAANPIVADPEATEKRLRLAHYSPAAIVSEVTSEIVSKRRQIITAICASGENGTFVESKVVFGPEGYERDLELELTDGQKKRHAGYRDRVSKVTSSVLG
ncbi:MAG: lactate/malate family dehydrogenase [Spirochaetales bacterium]